MVQILHEDDQIVVCVKPAGVLSQDQMPELLRQQLGAEEIFVIHRLDKEVGGVMVFAKTQNAAAALSRAVQERKLEKRYLAVLRGIPGEPSGRLEDLLYHDKARNKTYVVTRSRKGVKDAALEYKLLQTAEERSLVAIRLLTGRTHQIRVQFASRQMPLVGDGKYGGKTPGVPLGLWSRELTFPHPKTGKNMTFSQEPPVQRPWTDFR